VASALRAPAAPPPAAPPPAAPPPAAPPPAAPALHVTCAPSGVGKSAWVARAHPGAAVVCMDDLRLALTGRAEDQSRNREVFALALERLRGHLARGEEAVWDATSLTRAHRAPLLALGEGAGARVRLEVLVAPLDRALRGNLARARQVPEEVIRAQYARWELPARDEAGEVVYLVPDPSRPWGWRAL